MVSCLMISIERVRIMLWAHVIIARHSCFGTRKTIGVKEVHLITNALAVRRR